MARSTALVRKDGTDMVIRPQQRPEWNSNCEKTISKPAGLESKITQYNMTSWAKKNCIKKKHLNAIL